MGKDLPFFDSFDRLAWFQCIGEQYLFCVGTQISFLVKRLQEYINTININWLWWGAWQWSIKLSSISVNKPSIQVKDVSRTVACKEQNTLEIWSVKTINMWRHLESTQMTLSFLGRQMDECTTNGWVYVWMLRVVRPTTSVYVMNAANLWVNQELMMKIVSQLLSTYKLSCNGAPVVDQDDTKWQCGGV